MIYLNKPRYKIFYRPNPHNGKNYILEALNQHAFYYDCHKNENWGDIWKVDKTRIQMLINGMRSPKCK